jgi:hypothetical protein
MTARSISEMSNAVRCGTWGLLATTLIVLRFATTPAHAFDFEYMETEKAYNTTITPRPRGPVSDEEKKHPLRQSPQWWSSTPSGSSLRRSGNLAFSDPGM